MGFATQNPSVVVVGEIISPFDFSYDAAGNFVDEKTSPEADPDIDLEMAYQAANRLATHDGEVAQIYADSNMTQGPLSGGLANFAFDSRNRLVAAGNTAYRYDAEKKPTHGSQRRRARNSLCDKLPTRLEPSEHLIC